MRALTRCSLAAITFAALAFGTGCQSAAIGPGHRGILFLPDRGGVQHEVLQPGFVSLSCGPFTPDTKCPRLDNFRVTYQSQSEDIKTISQEGLAMNLHLTVVYRPIIAELYQLDTEIGPHYYEEVIRPEFRSAARSVFAHHSYLDLQKKNENIEHEIAAIVRRRTTGKHIEVSSILLESFGYDPRVAEEVRDTIVAESEAARRKADAENTAAQQKREIELADANQRLRIATEAAQKKLALETTTEQTKASLAAADDQKKMEIALQSEEERARLDSALRTKESERKLAEQQAVLDKLAAADRVTQAEGEARARLALASAEGAEKRAEAEGVTPMQVEMHAYDALAHLGGTGTTIMLGDFSHIPQFLFPQIPAFQSAFQLPWTPWTTSPSAPRVAGGTAPNSPY